MLKKITSPFDAFLEPMLTPVLDIAIKALIVVRTLRRAFGWHGEPHTCEQQILRCEERRPHASGFVQRPRRTAIPFCLCRRALILTPSLTRPRHSMPSP